MVAAEYAAFLSGLNQFVFALAAIVLFDSSTKRDRFNLFKIAYIFVTFVNLDNQIRHPEEKHVWRYMTVAFSGASMFLFLWTAYTTYRSPLHVISSRPGSMPETPLLYTSGPFARIRHPFYTSYLLNYAAMASGTASYINSLILVFMTCLYVQAAMSEEKWLAKGPLEQAYKDYCSRTRRFLPAVL